VAQGPPQASAQGVSIDTRRLQAGELFVALRGEQRDGHEFLHEAAKRGAGAALVESGKCRDWPRCPVIEVADTRRALGDLGAGYRRAFGLPIIAVGGSNGKTTVKSLLASLLGQRYVTLASEASFNNDLGVPLTLLRLERCHQMAVLEVGTNHPGELAPLIKMIRPRYAVICSLGREHLEFFGSLEGVAEEEGWLGELLPEEGALFVNGDSPAIDQVARRAKAKILRAGFGSANDWRASDAQLARSGTTFRVEAPDPAWGGEYTVPLVGRHQVVNALLALAVGAELGLNPAQARAGLAAAQPPKMRLQFSCVNEVRVLDDSYNANPDSMRTALETLRELADGGRRIAVLGEMAEQGVHAEAAHAEIGRLAAESGVDLLCVVGEKAQRLAEAAREAGLAQVREFTDCQIAADTVAEVVRPGDWVLVKASRVARLERVVERLRGPAGGRGESGGKCSTG
jgi:UDP-N-acetylmuramoyl-tripeptide--D-alanyl-D-alanine ligase